MQTRTRTDIWAFADPSWPTIDLTGFGVEALDGGIGSVDDVSHQTGTGHLVIDTGPWIFGRKVMLPAGVISGVDVEHRSITVALMKEQIKNAPELDEDRYADPAYRDELARHYTVTSTSERF